MVVCLGAAPTQEGRWGPNHKFVADRLSFVYPHSNSPIPSVGRATRPRSGMQQSLPIRLCRRLSWRQSIKSCVSNLGWSKLSDAAIRLGFPGVVLPLEVQLCMAPRISAQCGARAAPFQPARSIIQGLRNGLGFGRRLTHFILGRLCTARVASTQRIWVDDLYIGHKGSRGAVRKSIISGVVLVRDQVVGAAIQPAPESAILCDAMNDSKHISKVLRRKRSRYSSGVA
eukprot:56925-Pyramimonas_sp.AAC.1